MIRTRHHSQTNVAYLPKLVFSIHWTWLGKVHYFDIGNPGRRPPYPRSK